MAALPRRPASRPRASLRGPRRAALAGAVPARRAAARRADALRRRARGERRCRLADRDADARRPRARRARPARDRRTRPPLRRAAAHVQRAHDRRRRARPLPGEGRPAVRRARARRARPRRAAARPARRADGGAVTTRPGYLLPMRQTVLAFAGVMLAMLVAILNQTIVATALPTIVEDLGGVEHYSWVFSAYMLGSTVTVPVYGRLSDIYGRRLFFAFGLIVFMTGALLGAASGSMGMLIAARAVQGLGAGALIPLAIITIGDLVPPSDRGRWQGLTGAVIGVASVLGPFTGGWIVDHTSWRWVFLVSLPVGVLALAVVFATLRIPAHPDRERDLDYVGAGMLVVGVSALLLATVWGGALYPWGSAHVVGAFVGGAAVLALFARHERRVAHPIVPVGMFGAIMFVPLFVQGALGASATNSGVALTPLMLGMILTSVASGQVIARTGRYRWALLAGPLVMAVGFVSLASLDESSAL